MKAIPVSEQFASLPKVHPTIDAMRAILAELELFLENDGSNHVHGLRFGGESAH